MSTTSASDRFTALPGDQTLAATVVALEEHGFSVEVVDDFDAAREAVLALIPKDSTVMTNTSVTLEDTGIAAAINDGGPYESARNEMFALDFAMTRRGCSRPRAWPTGSATTCSPSRTIPTIPTSPRTSTRSPCWE